MILFHFSTAWNFLPKGTVSEISVEFIISISSFCLLRCSENENRTIILEALQL